MSAIPEATQNALAAQKRQSVKETRQKLELALRRLADGNPKVVKIGTKISASFRGSRGWRRPRYSLPLP